jgi:hypothetical protein
MASAATTETAFGGTYLLDEGVWKYTINRKPVKNAVTLKLSAGGVTILAAELLPDRLLSLRSVAEFLSIDYGTARTYHSKGILPNPVVAVDGRPYWTKPVIRAWRERRPGRGRGTRNRPSSSPYNVWQRTGEVI